MRADLLALTLDDLASLSNKGTANRARKEVDAGAPTGQLSESTEGNVTITWSDGVTCELPRDVPLKGTRCTCLAVGVCRHLVRSVLHYQKEQSAHASPATTGPWDPGAISDDELERVLGRSAVAAARVQAAEGALVELVRSAKPLARFHAPAYTVRFRVPGDLHYAAATCAPAQAPMAIALAVLAFRHLPTDEAAGVVAIGRPSVVPSEELARVEDVAREAFVHGFAGAPPTFADDLQRLERRLRAAGLVWPGENVLAIADEYRRYASHDAMFDPQGASRSLGELIARADAIRAGTVAHGLVAGTADDREVELGTTSFLALGCGVRLGRRGVRLDVYLQDTAVGDVSVVSSEFADPEAPAEPPPLHNLTARIIAKGISVRGLAAGHLTISRAHRAPTGSLRLGRGRTALAPQAGRWEDVREPLLVDDFAELRARLSSLPPSALRPLRPAENFHALACARSSPARFDVATQRISIDVEDAGGNRGRVTLPWLSRASSGLERVLGECATANVIRFVAGPVSIGADGLSVLPTAIVREQSDVRTILLPWIDAHSTAVNSSTAEKRSLQRDTAMHDALAQMHVVVAEVLVAGARRADDVLLARTRELIRQCEAVGLGRLPAIIHRLAQELEQRKHTPRWDPHPAVAILVELAAIMRLTSDAMTSPA